MSEMGDVSFDGAADVMAQLQGGEPMGPPEGMPIGEPMPPSDPGTEQAGACPECGAPMEGNVCQQCGYSHETPVPPENLPAPSMSAKCGIALGRVVMHIATQAVATPVTDPEALKTLGAAADSFASALQKVSPPPSTVDPTTAEKLAKEEVDAEAQLADAEAAREHEAVEKEADHERQLEQAEQQAAFQAAQAEQQAAQSPPGQQSR